MLYILISAGIFLTDFLIKNHVEKNYTSGEEKEILGGRILLHKYRNKGAALNVMEKNQKLVAGISGVLTGGVFAAFLYLCGKKGMGILKLGISLILGGACSNLYDRLRRKYVVDYFSFKTKWKKLRQIVFNISDICIFMGTFLFILWNMKNKS